MALPLYSATLLKGDSTASENETFSFPIGDVKIGSGRRIFASAAPGSTNSKEYSLSVLQNTSMTFDPVITATTVLDKNGTDIPNPIYNQPVTSLSILLRPLEMPTFVLENNKKKLYGLIIDYANKKHKLFEIENLFDANGQTSEGILSTISILPLSPINAVVAAVLPHGSNTFGDDGSGFALAVYREETVEKKENEEKQPNKQIFEQIGVILSNKITVTASESKTPLLKSEITPSEPKASTAESDTVVPESEAVVPEPEIVIPRARELTRKSDLVSLNGELSSISNDIALYYENYHMNSTFIGLQIKTGDNEDSIGSAIILGVTPGNHIPSFNLRKLVDDYSIFKGVTDGIIAAGGANLSISIHKLSVMNTSTRLPYLIVQGDNGLPEQTRRVVYALPLSHLRTGIFLASKKSHIEVISNNGGFFDGRGFKDPVIKAEDLVRSSDIEAQVGGGALLVGDIESMYVERDTVFVSVKSADEQQVPGIFSSQALFNKEGAIIAWTKWQRVANITHGVNQALFDAGMGQHIYFSSNNHDQTTIVKKTDWNDKDFHGCGYLQEIISQHLPLEKSGVQGANIFSPQEKGINNVSLYIATGLRRIVVAQTGLVVNNALIPIKGNDLSSCLTFDQGAITQDFPDGNTHIISIGGGALDTIGQITTSTIIQSGDNGYLLVGGVGGAAILSLPNGLGWDVATGLGNGFEGIVAGMAFKKFGSYTFIRSMIADDSFLYILTDTSLNRIDLRQSAIGLGENIESTTIATTKSMDVSALYDVVISDRFALLATSNGLFRVENGNNIQNGIPQWRQVPMPEGVPSAIAIVPVSQSGCVKDFARMTSNVYVISASRSKNRGYVYRYVVTPSETGEILDTTIEPFEDMFIVGCPSYYASLSEFRNIFATDGALYFTARSKDSSTGAPVFSHFPYNAMTGTLSMGYKSITIPLAYKNGARISSLLQASGSGSWFIAGDFGLLINE